MDNTRINKLKDWAESFCSENDLFLVDITSGAKNITITADGMENITIGQCAKLSRYLHNKIEESESNLLNDYTLDVSSPGMSNSLKLPIQYKKRLQKSLNFVLKNGSEFEATVVEVLDGEIVVVQIIPANKKTKEPEKSIRHTLTYNQIEKATIPFKFKKL